MAFLEEVSGRRYHEAWLSQALDLSVKAHKVFHDACELKKCHPNPLAPQESFAACFPNLDFKGTQECVDYYHGLYDEVKYGVPT